MNKMDSDNRHAYAFGGEDEASREQEGEGDNHQSAAFVLYEQTRQQQEQIERLQTNVQSNADLLASLMMSNAASINHQKVMPSSIDGSSMINFHPSLYPAASVPAAGEPLGPPTTNQEMIGLAEAQRQNMVQINPMVLHHLLAQQQAQQQMNPVVLQNQMRMFNHPPPQHLQTDVLQQDNQSRMLTHNSLSAGSFLPHPNTFQMPFEAHALFSSQARIQPEQNLFAGFRARQFVDHDDELNAAVCRGIIEPFPEKLHRLLRETEQAGQHDIISFSNDGNSFQIHKPDRFFKEVVPKYFKQSRLSSFKRQLNLYGFELIAAGMDRGGYMHESFKKDKPELCRTIRRRDVKFNSYRSNTKKLPTNSPTFTTGERSLEASEVNLDDLNPNIPKSSYEEG